MIISVEKRGRFWDRHWAARCSDTGMVSYGNTRERALMRLVEMHASLIAMMREHREATR